MHNLESLELNRIYQMDCLEGMKLIPDKSIDMILCDLPYGLTRIKWDSVIPLDELWEQYERIIKDNGAILLTAQTPFDKVLGMSNLKLLRYEWIWEKDGASGHLNANRMPLKAHENILVFYKKLPTYNPQMTEGHKPMNVTYGRRRKNNLYGKHVDLGCTDKRTIRFPRTVQKFLKPNNNGKRFHPTEKPIPLFEYLIKTYTNEGETVLDNCIGSGTTAIAATLNNRNWIGFETESEYVDIANKRLRVLADEKNNQTTNQSDKQTI